MWLTNSIDLRFTIVFLFYKDTHTSCTQIPPRRRGWITVHNCVVEFFCFLDLLSENWYTKEMKIDERTWRGPVRFLLGDPGETLWKLLPRSSCFYTKANGLSIMENIHIFLLKFTWLHFRKFWIYTKESSSNERPLCNTAYHVTVSVSIHCICSIGFPLHSETQWNNFVVHSSDTWTTFKFKVFQ